MIAKHQIGPVIWTTIIAISTIALLLLFHHEVKVKEQTIERECHFHDMVYAEETGASFCVDNNGAVYYFRKWIQ